MFPISTGAPVEKPLAKFFFGFFAVMLLGFIAPEDGSSDVFVHYSVIEGKGFRTLAENQKVEFEFKVGPKGPQATMVKKFAAPATK